MHQYPQYRLEGGQVVVQEKEGARWAPLDGAIAGAMLAVFDGMTLDALRNTLLSDDGGTPALLRVA
jgi:hypothetical protein